MWNDSNKWVFNKSCKSPEKLLAEALGYLDAFDVVHSLGFDSPLSCALNWLPPLVGSVKVNCDASLVAVCPGVGIGCCLRDSYGVLLRAVSIFKRCSPFVLLAELVAIAEGLKIAKDYGFPHVVLESDSKGAIDIVLSRELYLNEVGSVLLDIFEFAKNMDVIFNFVPRVCNVVAHSLARHALISSSSESWDSLFPDWLGDLVSHDRLI